MKLLLFLSELINFFVGGGNNLFSVLELVNERAVVFFGLKEDIVKLSVGSFELPCFLFKLLESSQTFVKEPVESFAFSLVFASFFFELFEIDG